MTTAEILVRAAVKIIVCWSPAWMAFAGYLLMIRTKGGAS